MNLWGLYHTQSRCWRSRSWQEAWGNINEAVTFISEVNTNKRLREHIKKWECYERCWRGIPQHKDAVTSLTKWKQVIPRKLILEEAK